MLFNLLGNSNRVNSISPCDARENITRDKSIVLLDVREISEYNSGHIKGAKLMPVGQVENQIAKLKVAKDTPLYVYCQSGGRSARACGILSKMGYTNIHNLGGIMSWPYEVVR